MEEISRVNLYSKVIDMIERKNELDNKVIEFLDDINQQTLDNYTKLLRLNVNILKNIEINFINTNRETEISIVTLPEIEVERLVSIYRENLESIEDYEGVISKKDISMLNNYVNYREEHAQYDGGIYYFFNSLLNLMIDISNRAISGWSFTTEFINKRPVFENCNQVFLSHAFADKLYTFSLFIYMLSNDIFLYVDWMFSPEFVNGIDIKANLKKELLRSKQLLFLRTINSELTIRGSGNIRGWCSWELGSFYSLDHCFYRQRFSEDLNKNNKFYISIYKSKNPEINNKQLDGIKPLMEIRGGKLA